MTVNFSNEFEKEMTYQDEFPSEIECEKCQGDMLPILQVADDSGQIAERRPPEARFWIHDACVIVVYQCTNCMELKADYNQG